MELIDCNQCLKSTAERLVQASGPSTANRLVLNLLGPKMGTDHHVQDARERLLQAGLVFQKPLPGIFCVPCQVYVGTHTDSLRCHQTRRHPLRIRGAVAHSRYVADTNRCEQDFKTVVESSPRDQEQTWRPYEDPIGQCLPKIPHLPVKLCRNCPAPLCFELFENVDTMQKHLRSNHVNRSRELDALKKIRQEKCQTLVNWKKRKYYRIMDTEDTSAALNLPQSLDYEENEIREKFLAFVNGSLNEDVEELPQDPLAKFNATNVREKSPFVSDTDPGSLLRQLSLSMQQACDISKPSSEPTDPFPKGM